MEGVEFRGRGARNGVMAGGGQGGARGGGGQGGARRRAETAIFEVKRLELFDLVQADARRVLRVVQLVQPLPQGVPASGVRVGGWGLGVEELRGWNEGVGRG